MKWLQEWYLNQCNGDWEHIFGPKISTIDNPGWKVEIPINETKGENKCFDSVKIERNDNDWLVCRIENNTFIGFGGPENLTEILTIFKKWWEEIGNSDD